MTAPKLFLILPALLTGYVCDKNMGRIYHPLKGFSTVWLVGLYSMFLILTLHDEIAIVKGILFAQLLIAAGYHDAQTHLIPDEFWIAILLDGLIQWNPIPSFIGFFTASFPLYLIAMTRRYLVGGVTKLLKAFGLPVRLKVHSNDAMIVKYGVGGDIKLLAACGFVLGPAGIVNAVIMGSMLFLLALVLQKIKMMQVKKMYAMTPFYAAGCCIAYLMKG